MAFGMFSSVTTEQSHMGARGTSAEVCFTGGKILCWLGEKIYNKCSQLMRLMKEKTTLHGGQSSII